jgi:GNAT superfamily N-acetyltransferase
MPWIEHLMEDEGLSYEDARDMLDGYDFIPYVEDGVHMATLLKKNSEVHFAGFKEYRGKGYITRRRLKEFLLPILKSEGFLTTKLHKDEPSRFIEKLGFVKVGESLGHNIYMMTELKVLEKKQ